MLPVQQHNSVMLIQCGVIEQGLLPLQCSLILTKEEVIFTVEPLCKGNPWTKAKVATTNSGLNRGVHLVRQVVNTN